MPENDPLLATSPKTRWIFGTPRLRADWQNLDDPGPLQGRVTTQEELWGVLVTMAVASMRDHIFENEDIVEYILYFFAFWGVVSATVNYSTRFNDEDLFHQTLWGLFLIGMTFQIAYCYHDLSKFAAATSFLYILMALAHFRVTYALPRARPFCLIFGLGHLFIGSAFAYLAMRADGDGPFSERRILWLNVVFEPVHLVFFVLMTCPWKPPSEPPVYDFAYYVRTYNPLSRFANSSWDLPLKVKYMIERFEGFQMMFVVVSVLFPIALSGPYFYQAVGAILLTNTYVTLLKFTMFDIPEAHHHGKDALKYHAVRRSRVTAILWLTGFPLSLLGISITGLGLVGAVNCVATGEGSTFARMCFCWGPWLTWEWQAINKSLHSSHHPLIHRLKTILMAVCAFGFLMPLALDLGTTAGLIFNMSVMAILLLSEVCVEIYYEGKMYGWDIQHPKLQVDWHNFATEGGKRAMNFVGAHVSSHEHFFTVLVAVSVFSNNVAFVQNQNFTEYITSFCVFYGVLEASIIYSCRFSVEDATHKLKWTAYECIFLLMLEGLTLGTDTNSNLFKITTAAMFFLLAFAFFGRVAVSVPRARKFARFYTMLYIIIGCLHLARVMYVGLDRPLLWAYCVMWLLATPLLNFFWMPKDDGSEEAMRALALFDVPANVDYIISRFNGLFMEILTVSIIVPNAFYPANPQQNLAGRRIDETDNVAGEVAYSNLVFWADLLVALLAIVIKFAMFDIQPVDHDHHAFVSGSRREEVLFLFLYPITSLGTAATGAGIAMMIPAIGMNGVDSFSTYAQRTLCSGASLTWITLGITKFLHAPSGNEMSHKGQIIAQLVGATLILIVALVGNLGDFHTFLVVVVISAMIVVAQEIVTLTYKEDADSTMNLTIGTGEKELYIEQQARNRGKSASRRFTALARHSIDEDDISNVVQMSQLTETDAEK